MSEQIFKGWIGKSNVNDLSNLENYGDNLSVVSGVFKQKGLKKEWDIEDWPPVKVELTIKVLD